MEGGVQLIIILFYWAEIKVKNNGVILSPLRSYKGLSFAVFRFTVIVVNIGIEVFS